MKDSTLTWVHLCRIAVRFALSLVLLFCGAASCSAQASTAGTEPQAVVLTQAEASELQTLLQTARQHNRNSLLELQEVKSELAQSELALRQAKEELALLRQELGTLKQASEAQTQRWKDVNSLLRVQLAEDRRTRRRIKAQRNFWECVAATCGVALIAKATKNR